MVSEWFNSQHGEPHVPSSSLPPRTDKPLSIHLLIAAAASGPLSSFGLRYETCEQTTMVRSCSQTSSRSTAHLRQLVEEAFVHIQAGLIGQSVEDWLYLRLGPGRHLCRSDTLVYSGASAS